MKNGGIPVKLRKRTNESGTISSALTAASNPSSNTASSFGGGVHFTVKKKTTMNVETEISFDPNANARGSFPSSSSSAISSTLPFTSSSHSQSRTNSNNASASANNTDALEALLNPNDMVRYIEELAKTVKR